MSLKDIFLNYNISNPSQNLEKQEISKEVESPELIDVYYKLSNKNLNSVNWLNPGEFAIYGSAEKYYEDAVKNIYNTYPYDGSRKEKLEWELNSSELTNYIFENYYPRQNGYINFGQNYGSTGLGYFKGYYTPETIEYIHFYGTLNTSEKANDSPSHFEYSNKLDHSTNRGFNLDINGESGNTVEFYFKRDNYSGSAKQVILDVWNSSSAYNDDYGRYIIEVHPSYLSSTNKDKFHIHLRSGSYGVDGFFLGSNLDFTGSWHHYAITSINSGSDLVFQLYVDGLKVDQVATGSNIGQIGGAVQGQIGSLITAASGAVGSNRGWGKLSGSLDEFRFWKTKRTDKEIRRNYFSQIGGGTNTDDSNTDLGVYFKFNEGIASTSTYDINNYDKIVLDYSGRISNGNWVGYSYGSRDTGSALVDSRNTDYEFKDPIVYSRQEEVARVLNFFKEHGEIYDRENENSIYKMFPSWIIEEDGENGEPLKNLAQIMAEFLDDLYLKIKSIPSLKNKEYVSEQEITFYRKLLNNLGFKNLDTFTNSSLLEEFLARNENENYEERLYKIKNKIYKNIYNNISEIYKSKGTTKSIRNILHSFGIDENLIKVNIYANDTSYLLENRYSYTSLKRKSLNLNNPNRFEATIYQKQDSSNSNSLGYLPGDDVIKYYGNTFETSIVFPKKFKRDNVLYFSSDFITSSLFGLHESDNGTWTTPDNASLQVYCVKQDKDSVDAYFYISSSCFSTELRSPLIKNIYNDQKWNLSLSLRKSKDLPYLITGVEDDTYILELYGVSSVQDIKQDSFNITSSVSKAEAENFFSSNKMIYLGAHRQNYTGSVIQKTDVKYLSARYWNKYLTNDELDFHSMRENCFGPKEANSIYRNNVKNLDTLALEWNFETITGSDSGLFPSGNQSDLDAGFLLVDISSGSVESLANDEISQYTKYQFSGRVDFLPRNSSDFLNTLYLPSILINNPENLKAEDLIKVLQRDDEVYSRETVPINHYFSIEKSMNQIVSQEILNWIGTLRDFNDLIGQPKYRYEVEYNNLNNLKKLFFERVEEETDFESFLDLYKWIDEAIYSAILQITPGSMDLINNVFNVFESHILERNKYAHKSPIIELKQNDKINVIQSQGRSYNSANPLLTKQNLNSLSLIKRQESSHVAQPSAQASSNELEFDRNNLPANRTGRIIPNSQSSLRADSPTIIVGQQNQTKNVAPSSMKDLVKNAPDLQGPAVVFDKKDLIPAKIKFKI